MEKEELKQEWVRLLKTNSIDDRLRVLDIYANFILNLGCRYNQFSSRQFHAGTMLQMFVCKNISLQQMIKGISYKTNEGLELNNILDPTTIIPHIRTIYELLCTFELVYVFPDSDEKKLILYNLWCIAGLKNRQRFYSETLTEEQKQQCYDEKEEIDYYEKKIKSTPIYNKEQNKKIIDNQIKQKKYQVIIDNDSNVHYYGLKEIPSHLGLTRGGLFENLYNFFSMYTHSSYIAALQFNAMFKERNDISIISGKLQDVIIMHSVFITDYMQLFPETKEYFFQQDLKTQMTLRMHARMVRNESIDLDEKWEIFS